MSEHRVDSTRHAGQAENERLRREVFGYHQAHAEQAARLRAVEGVAGRLVAALAVTLSPSFDLAARRIAEDALAATRAAGIKETTHDTH